MMSRIKSKVAWWLYKGLYKPGHFYSTIPSLTEVENDRRRIFANEAPLKIDLRPEEQKNLLSDLVGYVDEFPWPAEPSTGLRYYTNNGFFNYADAFALYGMLRRLKPRKVIEIGSGFSSAVMMDTNEQFLNTSLKITFVEPYSERLQKLMRQGDHAVSAYQLIEKRIQDVPMDIFQTLEAGDIFFVDSSHVSKVGSDLNHILFNIVPRLKPGVILHFHDIFYPFEYPEGWIKQGIFWNEVYLLRAFLMNNKQYEVLLMNDYWDKQSFPAIPRFKSGGSLWLKKVAD
jgi:predicted O-methyltransferase YrrM